jgi:WD40 repeat protein
LYIHDSIKGKTKPCEIKGDDSLLKALPLGLKDIVLVYEKHIVFDSAGQTVKQKKGQIRNASEHDNKLAIVGKDIPLKVFDVKTRNKIFEADPPEKNWLGLQPECEVIGLDFVGQTRVATCSKSDSVIRVYDTANGKSKPIITVDISQTAFIEYAEAGRFVSVASTGDQGHSIVVGSNVGQLLAIDLRFNVKQLNPKKRLQPKTFKILGGFKGARGATL